MIIYSPMSEEHQHERSPVSRRTEFTPRHGKTYGSCNPSSYQIGHIHTNGGARQIEMKTK
jgi:hypothetical protein